MHLIVRALTVLIASAGTAHAEPQATRFFNTAFEESRGPRQFVTSSYEEGTVRSSRFFAALAVAPNTTVGVGRFNCLPRRRIGMHDQPVTLERKATRRAAVGLSVRF